MLMYAFGIKKTHRVFFNLLYFVRNFHASLQGHLALLETLQTSGSSIAVLLDALREWLNFRINVQQG